MRPSTTRLTRVSLVAAAVAALTVPMAVAGTAAADPATEPAQAAPAVDQQDAKPRTIITQDGEIDDMDSFVRFLYYANEVDLEGIVYSSSRYHYSGNGADVAPFRWTGTDWVYEYLDDYEEIYPNLAKHADGYPTPEYLRSIYKIGNVENVSEMEKITEGSEFIKGIILDDDPRPVHVQTWGGLNTLARALKSIQEEYSGTAQWADIQAKVNAKVVIYNILNQDSTLAGYIKPNWPGVKIIDNQSQFWSFAYRWPNTVPQPYQYTLKGPWMQENLLTGHGSLLAGYHTWGDGQAIAGENANEDRWSPDRSVNPLAQFPTSGRTQYDFISEGDSPSFFYLLGFNGLRQQEDPTWGGWGGRFTPNATGWIDTTDFNTFTNANDRSFPQTRWVEAIQNDFAARADWGVSDSYEDANHNPAASVAEGLDLVRRAGETVTLVGSATDPDGDAVALEWWDYAEAGTYPGSALALTQDGGNVTFQVPADATPGQTIHLILEATDDGTPALTHYQRVVITIAEAADPDGIALEATVPDTSTEPGTLTLSIASYGDAVRFSEARNLGDRLTFDAYLPEVTVTDTRNATQTAEGGWALTGRSSSFVANDAQFSADHLGWTPRVTPARDGLTAGTPTLGTLRGGPGLAQPATLASANDTGRAGIARASADLRLEIPVDTPDGDYSASLSVSLFPTD
ncbi:DUF1593 domain-containing protein [Miniimonas arenae]|uniref:DUF1593 domain-containing protein n=1 Tax=Miniimonas arenae TaxID=676201 RepID=UPI0028AD834F|nr:nucleoside hydrolase-like domain-containing protein [Miniimonas arenae]